MPPKFHLVKWRLTELARKEVFQELKSQSLSSIENKVAICSFSGAVENDSIFKTKSPDDVGN